MNPVSGSKEFFFFFHVNNFTKDIAQQSIAYEAVIHPLEALAQAKGKKIKSKCAIMNLNSFFVRFRPKHFAIGFPKISIPRGII